MPRGTPEILEALKGIYQAHKSHIKTSVKAICFEMTRQQPYRLTSHFISYTWPEPGT